jgi:hypothetical protein
MPTVNSPYFAVWIITIFLYAALAGILIYRGAVSRWPWLFLYTTAASLLGVALFILYFVGCSAGYFWTYWLGRFFLASCEFGILWSIANRLIGVNAKWRRGLFVGMIILSVVALLISGLSVANAPIPYYLAVTRFVMAIDRWISLTACLLFVFIVYAFDVLGIKWRHEVLAIGFGFALQGTVLAIFAWIASSTAFSQTTLQIPSIIRDLLNLAAVAVWIYAFRPKNEPGKQLHISAERLSNAIDSIEQFTIHQ